ncbi:DUF6221 family protein [Blastococcus sp. TF02-9]|uniref:DUF6221 family protein n=1 Tax=Blastococcus sp. TF02-09 TaxID=2250576 RepID=UPI0011BDAF04|nr:DUF6221 family protein [Blastococcus sp. TF02-9]
MGSEQIERMLSFIQAKVYEDGYLAAQVDPPYLDADDMRAATSNRLDSLVADHIERWSPMRVMKQSALLNEVVDLLRRGVGDDPASEHADALYLGVITRLAELYDETPDYDARWAAVLPDPDNSSEVVIVRTMSSHGGRSGPDAETGDWKPPAIEPPNFTMGDYVSITESRGLRWSGVVVGIYSHHIAVRSNKVGRDARPKGNRKRF